MQFGKVEHPSLVDFTLPPDNPETAKLLEKYKDNSAFEVYVGCAKWNRTELKGFYPRGTKDELAYYSTQFNSIELNATFYGIPKWEQVETWRNKTPDDFKFFPKVSDLITHYRRLNNVDEPIQTFSNAVSNFQEKLGWRSCSCTITSSRKILRSWKLRYGCFLPDFRWRSKYEMPNGLKLPCLNDFQLYFQH